MAQLALTVAGAAVGSYFGYPGVGAAAGAIVGAGVEYLLSDGQPATQPPRVGDLRVQASTYGNMIPIGYGTFRVAGNVIWSTKIKATKHVTDVGGGLGFGGSGTSQTTYTYSVSFAVGLCKGPIKGIMRVWADNKLIHDGRPGSKRPVKRRGSKIRVYTGSTTQMPDPAIMAHMGADITPAFRGLAYIVIEHLHLADFANHIPNITVEVVALGLDAFPSVTLNTGGTTFGNAFAISSDGAHITRYGGAGDTDNVDTQNVEMIAGPSFALNGNGGANTIFGDDGYIYYSSGPAAGGMGVVNYAPWTKLDPITLEVLETIGAWSTTFDSPNMDLIGRIDWFKNGGPYVYGFGHQAFFSDYGINIASIGLVEKTAAQGAGHFRWVAKTEIISSHDPAYNDGVLDPTTIREVLPGTIDQLTNLLVQAFVDVLGSANLPLLMSETDGTATLSDWWLILGDSSTTALTLYHLCLIDYHTHGGKLSFEGQNPLITVETFALGANFTLTGASCNVMYVPDEHALVIYRTQAAGTNSMIKFSLDSKTVTGAELMVPKGISMSQILEGPADGFLYAGTGRFVDIYDVGAWALVNTIDLNNWGCPGGDIVSDIKNDCIWVLQGTTLYKILLNKITPQTPALSTIVADLVERSGLASSDIVVTELTDGVSGYFLSRQTDLKSALQPLVTAYAFDVVESDYQLKFRKRSAASSVTIDVSDLGAYDGKSSRPDDPLPNTDADPDTLPRRVAVKHINPNADYQDDTQSDQRDAALVTTKSEVMLDVPVCLSEDAAKVIATRWLQEAWVGSRTFETATSLKYILLDPLDNIVVTNGNESYTLGIEQVDLGANWLIKWALRVRDLTIYVPVPTVGGVGGGSYGFVPDSLADSGDISTVPALLDIVLLEDTDDGVGWYLGLAPSSDDGNWLGGTLLRSVDNGQSYQQFKSSTDEATLGSSIGILPDAPGGRWNTWDRVNTLKVRINSGAANIVSQTETAVLNGMNRALLGNEVIAFVTAVNNGDGTFTLSTLLRGLRGSNPYVATHVNGERFAMLDKTISDVSVSDLNLARLYKAVSIGSDTLPSVNYRFTDTGQRLMPLTASEVKLARDSVGNLGLSWIRETRLGADNDWLDGVTTVPLGEATESYDVDVIKAGSVVRTFSCLMSPALSYMTTDQITDFGSVQTSVRFKIYQNSETIGRGFVVDVTLDATLLATLGTVLQPSPTCGGSGAGVGGSATSGFYDISAEWLDSSIPINQTLGYWKATRTVTLPAGLGGSMANLHDAPSSFTVVIDIRKNGVSFGSITFNVGSNAGTFTSTAGAVLNAGDLLEFVAPASADPSAGRFTATLKGTWS